MTETWNNGRHESLRGDSERGERRSTSHQKSGLPVFPQRPPRGVLRDKKFRRQCGASLLSRAVPPSLPLTQSVGSTPEGVSLTPGQIITTASETEKTQTCPRGSPSTRGHAGSVSLHAHIPGDIASFPTKHGAEGAVLTTTSQCEFRSLAYL